MKTVKMTKIQPAEVRAYKACPEVRTIANDMGWRDFRPAGYLLAIERLEAEGNYVSHVDNILLALSDVSPSLRSTHLNVKSVLDAEETAGRVRKAVNANGQIIYTLTTHGHRAVGEIRSAVITFAAWEAKLPGGRFTQKLDVTKNDKIKALTEENEALSTLVRSKTRAVQERDERIMELEMLVAALTRP